MSGLRRFYSEEPLEEDRAVITGSEAHHILRVVRLRVGETALLFDGSGVECSSRLIASARGRAEFEILSRELVDREPSVAVTVASAVPKGKRAEFLVEKCCEIGAKAFVPLTCARSVVDPRVRPENHLARWRRTVIETSKQCGRTRLMEVIDPQSLTECVERGGDRDGRWICLPGIPERTVSAKGAASAMLLIGPEGGFDAEEVSLADRCGFRALSLGKTTLRVETACFVALTLLVHA